MGGSGGALGELWEALAELREALGELWEGLYIQKLTINLPSGRYVIRSLHVMRLSVCFCTYFAQLYHSLLLAQAEIVAQLTDSI